MTEQVIYSRYEYPIGGMPTGVIFKEYQGMDVRDERGIIVGGLNVAIRDGRSRAAIVMTYDAQSDTYARLKLTGIKGLMINRYIVNKEENV